MKVINVPTQSNPAFWAGLFQQNIQSAERKKKRMYNVKLAESKLCDDDPTEARGVCCATALQLAPVAVGAAIFIHHQPPPACWLAQL